ncbi:4a-hydroxytetrahydrobiopterin dehydratase [Barrientosiimonas humi]|uniref:Putative pterin-4-alpha-carbinolamine dehydratase n=1 Tax=Barrientosiimonas humi TaxID=999931 RepID=A0A542XFB6_9MICO|nr:4a-hydroxytetrahydrobiopterin dehydratase [Barrientosiimonas humi]TQL34508.1 4a-hydroxytetrahydrobiopterin dehydratase [Barrientosiimonas humi]CAG7574498.1 Putative pterin-4-alpha-carbinolamine dehydratase [Barrientosiimonas humi]
MSSQSSDDRPALDLPDWNRAGTAIVATFSTDDFAAGVRFVQAIGEAADRANHHPDVDLRFDHVTVRSVSHDVGKVTDRDLDLARTISGLAREQGLSAQGAADLRFADDAPVPPGSVQFWTAVAGIEPGASVDLSTDHQTVTFTDDAGQTRYRVNVPTVDTPSGDRVRAALDAGGSLLDDSRAPDWWLLGDGAGNQARVCDATDGIPPLAQDLPLAR